MTGTANRLARKVVRIANGVRRPATRSRYIAVASQRIRGPLTRGPVEPCIVCGSRSARVVSVTDETPAAGERPRTCRVRICSVCGHVGNPENTLDYRQYDELEGMTDAARIGTLDREGREYHMARMAADILGRGSLDVLVYGVGRSFDNRHIAGLPTVRLVAIADVMRLRDEVDFIDANLPAPRRFDIVLASEVVEHFEDPHADFARLLEFVEDDGLLVCGTNVYDGGRLERQHYLFISGHTSYYSTGSLARIAKANGALVDIRIPEVATGYGGPRKRYVLLTRSTVVMDAIARYFETHVYAPSESPTARADIKAAIAASAGAGTDRDGSRDRGA